jgi:hypothetical protein
MHLTALLTGLRNDLIIKGAWQGQGFTFYYFPLDPTNQLSQT